MREERGNSQNLAFVGTCALGVAIGLALLFSKAYGPVAGWLSLPFGFFLGATSGIGMGALQAAIRILKSEEIDQG